MKGKNENDAKKFLEELATVVKIKLPEIENSLKKKDVTLVLGATGSGKSTAICYLMGCQMEEIEKIINGEQKSVVEVSEQSKAEMSQRSVKLPVIGHTRESETIFPEPYVTEHGLILGDCAGFFENKISHEGVFASISLELAIRYVKSIQSIMVIVDYQSFINPRGDDRFVNLAKILEKLFPGSLKEISKSILYVFGNAFSGRSRQQLSSSKIQENIKNRVKQLQEEIKEKWGKSSYITQEEKTNKLLELNLCDAISSNANILAIDVLDKGESLGPIILNLTEEKNPIPKETFSFGPYDASRKKLQNIGQEVANEGLQKIERKRNLQNQLKDYQTQETSLKTRIKYFEENLSISSQIIDTVNNTMLSGEEKIKQQENLKESQINLKKNRIEEIKKQIENYRVNMIPQCNFEKQKFSEQKERLLEEKDSFLWGDEVDEKRSRLVWIIPSLAYTRKSFEYSASRFTYVKKEPPEVDIDTLENNPTEGKYKAVYESNRGSDGKAAIKIFVTAKDKYEASIKSIEKNIFEIEHSIKEIEQLHIPRLDAESRNLDKEIEDSPKQRVEDGDVKESLRLKNQNQRRIENLEIKKKKALHEKDEIISSIKKVTAELASYESDIKENLPLYENFEFLYSQIAFANEDKVITNFLSELKEYRKYSTSKQSVSSSIWEKQTGHIGNQSFLGPSKDAVVSSIEQLTQNPLFQAFRNEYGEHVHLSLNNETLILTLPHPNESPTGRTDYSMPIIVTALTDVEACLSPIFSSMQGFRSMALLENQLHIKFASEVTAEDIRRKLEKVLEQQNIPQSALSELSKTS